MNNTEQVEAIMNQTLAMMPDELAKNWLKIHQYLTVSHALLIKSRYSSYMM
jgi:hypothetical protein